MLIPLSLMDGYPRAMATISFDTHKFVKTLQDAGFDQKQAEALTAAVREASGEAELATKRDLERMESKLDARFEKLDGRLTLIQWMLALVVAAEVIPVLSKLFHG